MKVLLSIATIVVVSVTSLLAQDISSKVEKESYSHNQRIQILEDADRCIKNAQNKDEYKQCEAKEKAARKSLKGELKNMSMSQAKEKILSRIDRRIKKLENAKECVKSAQSKEELKACKPKRDKGRKNKHDRPEKMQR